MRCTWQFFFDFLKWITDKRNESENKRISVLAVPASIVSAVKSKRGRYRNFLGKASWGIAAHTGIMPGFRWIAARHKFRRSAWEVWWRWTTNHAHEKRKTLLAIGLQLGASLRSYWVADPGCLSRIRIFPTRIRIFPSRIPNPNFSIPDPESEFFHPGFKFFHPGSKFFHPGSKFFHPGSKFFHAGSRFRARIKEFKY